MLIILFCFSFFWKSTLEAVSWCERAAQLIVLTVCDLILEDLSSRLATVQHNGEMLLKVRTRIQTWNISAREPSIPDISVFAWYPISSTAMLSCDGVEKVWAIAIDLREVLLAEHPCQKVSFSRIQLGTPQVFKRPINIKDFSSRSLYRMHTKYGWICPCTHCERGGPLLCFKARQPLAKDALIKPCSQCKLYVPGKAVHHTTPCET